MLNQVCFQNDYFANLNEKHTKENKCFLKTVKVFLPNKVQSYERRKLEEDDTLITNQEEVAMNLTNFF